MSASIRRRASWLLACAAGAVLVLLWLAGKSSGLTPLDVSVTQTGPSTYTVGTPFPYMVTVTVSGGTTNVTVTDILPVGVNFVTQGSDSRCSDPAGGGTVTCFIPNTSGTALTIMANPTSSAANTIVNVVGVIGSAPDSNMANNSFSWQSTRQGAPTPTPTPTSTGPTATPTPNRTPTRTPTGGPPPPPTGLVATAISSNSISLTWNGSLGATSYEIDRKSGGSDFGAIGFTNQTSYTDSYLVTRRTYVYQIKAVGPGGTSGPSAPDLATTFFFTDDPLLPGTPVRANHIVELRDAVNMVRVAANLSVFNNWTDPTLSRGGTPVRAVHINELRTKETEARVRLGFNDPPFTDPNLTIDVTIVKKIHIDELRQRVK